MVSETGGLVHHYLNKLAIRLVMSPASAESRSITVKGASQLVTRSTRHTLKSPTIV